MSNEDNKKDAEFALNNEITIALISRSITEYIEDILDADERVIVLLNEQTLADVSKNIIYDLGQQNFKIGKIN